MNSDELEVPNVIHRVASTPTEVGQKHNIGLDSLYIELLNTNDLTSLSDSELIVNSRQAVIDYLEDDEGYEISDINAIFDSIGANDCTTLAGYVEYQEDSIMSEINNKVEDDDFKDMLEDIVYICENPLITYSELDAALTSIENDAANTDYEDEIASIASVMRNSYQYWALY